MPSHACVRHDDVNFYADIHSAGVQSEDYNRGSWRQPQTTAFHLSKQSIRKRTQHFRTRYLVSRQDYDARCTPKKPSTFQFSSFEMQDHQPANGHLSSHIPNGSPALKPSTTISPPLHVTIIQRTFSALIGLIFITTAVW